jgi:hypothetical protein
MKRTNGSGADTVMVAARVPVAHARRLKEMAKRNDLTSSQLFRRMIRELIDGGNRENPAKP